jgi:hypothetical protein
MPSAGEQEVSHYACLCSLHLPPDVLLLLTLTCLIRGASSDVVEKYQNYGFVSGGGRGEWRTYSMHIAGHMLIQAVGSLQPQLILYLLLAQFCGLTLKSCRQ